MSGIKCEVCGEEVSGGSAFTCSYCKGVFCPGHRLPFNHSCKNLSEWKKAGLTDGKRRMGYSGKRNRSFLSLHIKELIYAGVIILFLCIIVLSVVLR